MKPKKLDPNDTNFKNGWYWLKTAEGCWPFYVERIPKKTTAISGITGNRLYVEKGRFEIYHEKCTDSEWGYPASADFSWDNVIDYAPVKLPKRFW